MFLKIFTKRQNPEGPSEYKPISAYSFLAQHEFSVLTVELGKKLFRQNSFISAKICELRSEMFREYGFLLPKVNIRVNKKLSPSGFSIMVRDSLVYDSVPTEPSSADEIRQQLQRAIFQYPEYIFTRASALKLLEFYAAHSPAARFIMQQYKSQFNMLSNFHKLLMALLKERVPIKDIDIIAGMLTDTDENITIDKLIELTRRRLSLSITARAKKDHGVIKAFLLSDRTQEFVDDTVTKEKSGLRIDLPYSKNKELRQLLNAKLKPKLQRAGSIILIEQSVRRKLYFLLRNMTGIDVTVISFDEINRNLAHKIEVLGELDFVLSGSAGASDKEIRLDEFFIH